MPQRVNNQGAQPHISSHERGTKKVEMRPHKNRKVMVRWMGWLGESYKEVHDSLFP